MAESEVDDIFKDYEYKVKGKEEKKEQPKVEKPKKLEEEPEKKIVREKIPPKKMPNYERIGYIAIIIVLIAYIAIDLSSYHNDDPVAEVTVSVESDQTEESGATEAETPDETESVQEVNETTEADSEATTNESTETTFSGIVTLTLDKVEMSVNEKDSDLGYIEKVLFTIDNDKDASLKPFLQVYIYDSEIDESWETKSRGDYTGSALEPGEKSSGSITVSPKTFRALDVEKSLRLVLNDTVTGFVASVNEQVTIS